MSERPTFRFVIAVLLGSVIGIGASAGAASQAARTTNEAVFTNPQADRGQIVYQERCASCHGSTLGGVESAPALTGPGFAASWSGVPVADFFERIRLSMPLDDPGSLGRRQTADLIAYILRFNKAPAGDAELPAEVEVLKTITIAPIR
jgi:quinoprotein glucose dehydrogenase